MRFKYQQNLSHLILGSTFASTRELNVVPAKIKAAMPPQDRARVDTLESAGLYGKGELWEHGRYTDEYAKLAWGMGCFPYVYQNRPDPNYDPSASNTGMHGTSIAKCGARTASSSWTATSRS